MTKEESPSEIMLRSEDTTPETLARPTGVRTNVQLRIEAVRELINELVNQSVILQTESKYSDDVPAFNLRDEVRRFEIDLIQKALNHSGGSQVKAARFLGLNATTLHEKIKRYGLQYSRLVHYARSPLSRAKEA